MVQQSSHKHQTAHASWEATMRCLLSPRVQHHTTICTYVCHYNTHTHTLQSTLMPSNCTVTCPDLNGNIPGQSDDLHMVITGTKPARAQVPWQWWVVAVVGAVAVVLWAGAGSLFAGRGEGSAAAAARAMRTTMVTNCCCHLPQRSRMSSSMYRKLMIRRRRPSTGCSSKRPTCCISVASDNLDLTRFGSSSPSA